MTVYECFFCRWSFHEAYALRAHERECEAWKAGPGYAVEPGYALATADAVAWCIAHDFPAVAEALQRGAHRGAS